MWRALLTNLLIEGEVMKTRNTFTKLITITLAVAALAAAGLLNGAGLLQPVEAQTSDGSVRSVSFAPIGIIPGQRLSYSLLNPNEEGSQPVRAQAYIYDSYGRLMSQTDPAELRPGQFHTFDFNRDDLPVAGEEGTGRLQVRAGIQVLLLDGSVRSVEFPISVEVVNNRTGVTEGGPYFTGSVTVSDD